MTNTRAKPSRRRKILAFVALLPVASVHAAAGSRNDTAVDQSRFRDIGAVLVVDAVPGAELKHVVIYDDRGYEIFASGTVSRTVRKILALGGFHIPLRVRAIWRRGAGWDNVSRVWNEGVIAGDYTVPVAKRIPDLVLSDIRAHGGNLRLKFRLKPDGILFGWDIERTAPLGDVSIFEMPGGDFLETHY